MRSPSASAQVGWVTLPLAAPPSGVLAWAVVLPLIEMVGQIIAERGKDISSSACGL
jgi:hypothetical protein